MNIYFIANINLQSSQLEYINSTFIPTKNDLIVRFNNARDTKLFNNKCDILISRKGKDRLNGFIKDNTLKHVNLELDSNITVYPITKGNDISKLKQEITKYNPNIKFSTFDIKVSDYNNPLIKGEPSTGYIGFNFIYNTINAEHYYLIGFDFHENTKWNDKLMWNQFSGHDFKSEKNIMLNLINNDNRIVLIKKDNFISYLGDNIKE